MSKPSLMNTPTFTLPEATAVLARTPDTLRALLSGLDAPWTNANEGPNTFSAFDVVGHLIDGEETDWIPRARMILDQGAHRDFAPFDRFRHYKRNCGRNLVELLDEFGRLRAASLADLQGMGLTEHELSLEGVHPEFGPVSLRQLLATWVVHDLGHIAQIARVMAKRYAADVGPWSDFLPILTRR